MADQSRQTLPPISSLLNLLNPQFNRPWHTSAEALAIYPAYGQLSDSYYTRFAPLITIMPQKPIYGTLAFRVDSQLPPRAQPCPLTITRKRISDASDDESLQPKRKKERIKAPKLRKGRKVIQHIPDDVWIVIFSFCEPKLLPQMRLVSKSFCSMLDTYSKTWEHCRNHKFGEGIPPPPTGMKEFQYLDLLSGQGCHSCKNQTIRKAYWAFLRRWCEPCFKKQIAKSFPGTQLFSDPRLGSCIMSATVDSWGSYECAGSEIAQIPRNNHMRFTVFRQTDVQKINEEYMNMREAVRKEYSTDEEMIAAVAKWLAEKTSHVQGRLIEIKAIEKWEKSQDAVKKSKNKDLKTQRQEYYQAKASAMNPPLSKEALKLIPAYQKAIKILKVPTERSWKILKDKLEKSRAAAEEVVESEKSSMEFNKWELYSNLQAERNSPIASPEQRLLLELASEAIKQLEIEEGKELKIIIDQDFAIRTLNMVWSMYAALPDSQRPPSPLPRSIHPDGKYAPTMHDACMIFEYKILPTLCKRKSSRTKVVKTFKCPGCTRNDVQKRFHFKDLFLHIREKHAAEVGDFQMFRKGGTRMDCYYFAWIAVPWTRKLPILAEHHIATGHWDPNDDSPYLSYEPPSVDVFSDLSAFEGRSVATNLEGQAPPMDFIGHIKVASNLLREVQINSEYKTRIAFDYSLDRFRKYHPNDRTASPEFAECEKLPRELISIQDHELFDGLCCSACASIDKSGKHFGNTPHSRVDLINHYATIRSNWDHREADWTENLFLLPSVSELRKVLYQPGNEAALAVFDKLFPFDPVVEHSTPQRSMQISELLM